MSNNSRFEEIRRRNGSGLNLPIPAGPIGSDVGFIPTTRADFERIQQNPNANQQFNPYQQQLGNTPAGRIGTGISSSYFAPMPAGGGVADGVQMPSPDYMRMLTDFQAQGGSVGENATKKLAEAQAIIDANQSQVTQTMQSPAYQDLSMRYSNSQGQDQDAKRQLEQYQQQFRNIMGRGNQSQPFSYVGSGYRYDDYDPATNTVSYNQSGIAGNMDMGRVSVADLMNPENVFDKRKPFDPSNPIDPFGTYYDEDFASSFNQFQNQNLLAAGSGGNQSQPSGTSPITLPPTGSSGPSSSTVYGGAALGGLLSGDLQGALQTAAGYYAGQQGIEGAMATGQAGFGLGEQIGQRAFEQSQFKPFGVTSNLANIGTTAAGGVDLRLSQPQQRLQNQLLGGAQAAASTIGGAYDPRVGQIGAQAYGQAQQQLGQVGALDPSIAAQRGAVGGLFGQTLGQMGQPTGFEGITQAGLGGAQEQLKRASQPADINQLRGQFAGQVGGMLTQTPNEQIGQLGQQALGLGSQGLAGLEAPTDIESLRSQYAGLAGAAGQGLLTSPEQRQADIYESIRATQTPEEERQRLATEERLLAQGRLGLSSAAYGGASPELLAQETARQEAMARAGLSARQQALMEQQQEVATAQSLTGLATGLAGTSSDIQSAAQSRASQLSQLGLSAEQIESQLQSEGLSRGVTAGTTAGQLAGIASDLETAGIGRGATLANVGLAGAQAGRGFEQQDLANLLQLQQADIGAAGQQQALQQGRLGLGTGLFGLGTQASQLPSQLRAADIANMQQMMAAGYLPQQQALGLFGAAELPSQLAMKGQLGGTELQAQAARSGLESYMQGANMANVLQQQQLQGMLSSVLGQQMTPQERLINQILGGNADAGGGGLLGALGVGEGKTPDLIKSIGDALGFGGSGNLGSAGYNDLLTSIIGNAGGGQSEETKGMLDAFNALGIGGG
jgi:hypothetical protein